MAIQKTEAIILKTLKQGETSKILTLYTLNYGLESIIAKGSRNTKSRFAGSLEPLNYLSIVYYRKENRDLQFLSQADIRQSFPGIRKDIEKTTLALVICEIVQRTQFAAEKNPALFSLIIRMLRAIERAASANINLLFSFQLKFLGLSGYAPRLENCLSCQRPPTDEHLFFDYSHGGFVCSNCQASGLSGKSYSLNTIKYLSWIQRSTTEVIARHKIPTPITDEAALWMHDYTLYHIEGIENLNSLKIFNQIKTS